MTHLRSTAASRSLTVVLSESDWHALRQVEPDAVGWLQGCIRERLGAAAKPVGTPSSHAPAGKPSVWGEDQY
jgi:hypothetical protein